MGNWSANDTRNQQGSAPAYKGVVSASTSARTASKLRQHHRRGAPHVRALHIEERHVHDPAGRALPEALLPLDRGRLPQPRQGRHDEPLHLRGRQQESRAGRGQSDHRVQQMAADGNRQRRQLAEHRDVGGREPHLLIRLSQRRLLDGFAGVQAPPGQRDLARVVGQRRGPNGQRHPPVAVLGIEQQERGRIPERAGHRRASAGAGGAPSAAAPRSLAAARRAAGAGRRDRTSRIRLSPTRALPQRQRDFAARVAGRGPQHRASGAGRDLELRGRCAGSCRLRRCRRSETAVGASTSSPTTSRSMRSPVRDSAGPGGGHPQRQVHAQHVGEPSRADAGQRRRHGREWSPAGEPRC